jgi:hypothetical protein
VECIAVEFQPSTNPNDFHPKELQVIVEVSPIDFTIVGEEDSDAVKEAFSSFSHVLERSYVEKVSVAPELIDREGDGITKLHVTVQMVRLRKPLDEGQEEDPEDGELPTTGGGRIIGCILKGKDGGALYSILFDTDLASPKEQVQANCKLAICILAQDGKMATCSSGQKTCGVKYSCLRCLWNGDASYPSWAREFPDLLPDGADVKCFEIREESKSNAELFKKYEQLVGKDSVRSTTQKVQDWIKEQTASVSEKPTFDIHPDLHSGDPMHMSQGYMTHLTEAAMRELGNISGGGFSEAVTEDCLRICDNEVAKENQSSFRDAKREVKKLQGQIKKLEVSLATLKKAGNAPDLLIRTKQAERDALFGELEDLDRSTNYSDTNAQVRGAKAMKKVVSDSTGAPAKSDSFNEAQFVFYRSIKQYAGAGFNKARGGDSVELTNNRGMKALERRQEIASITSKAFEKSNPEKNAAVIEVMEWWLQMADELYEISKLLKSQQKLTGDRLQTLKRHVLKYGIGWRKRVTWKKPVFWKMHTLECLFINFAGVHGFGGRVSTEGFENKHFLMRRLKAMLSSMFNTGQRIQKLSQRQQIHIIPCVAAVFDRMQRAKEARSTGPRGPYRNRGQTRNQEELPDVPERNNSTEENCPEGYFKMPDGNLLPEDLREFYTFFAHGKVPEAWTDSFKTSDQLLGSRAQLQVQYTS